MTLLLDAGFPSDCATAPSACCPFRVRYVPDSVGALVTATSDVFTWQGGY
jgi:hypothetical protein